MRAEPTDLDEAELARALELGWGLRIATCRYVPVGGGSHHWRAVDADGKPHWVTVDDLDHRGYLGNERDGAFAALRDALEIAASLRDEARLEFVVAPIPTVDGARLQALGSHYALAVYPYLDADPLTFGEPLGAPAASLLADMLARLHTARRSLPLSIRRSNVDLPGRPGLELALGELDAPWVGGPFSEPARRAVARQQAGIRELLRAFDDLLDRAAADGQPAVVTHGEPHPANLLVAGDRLLLVDWDTVAADAPERDLWWLGGHPGALERYERAAGRMVNRLRMQLYSLRWKLDDISSFVLLFRSPHDRNPDTERWWSFADRMTSS